MAILKPIASTAAASSVTSYAEMAVANTCIVGITTATRACVNTLYLRTVNTVPNINAVSPTAITADGPDLSTALTTNKQARQGHSLPCGCCARRALATDQDLLAMVIKR